MPSHASQRQAQSGFWVALLVFGAFLCLEGALQFTAPTTLGGPMAISLDGILGLPMMVMGLLVIFFATPRATTRAAGVLAGVSALIYGVAAYNFICYPPISDGAYAMLRYGPDPYLYPASAGEQATTFCVAASILYAALVRRTAGIDNGFLPVRDTLMAIGGGTLTTFCYTNFIESYAYSLESYGPALQYLGPAVVLACAGAVFVRRTRFAAAALVFAGTSICLFVGTIVLYWMG